MSTARERVLQRIRDRRASATSHPAVHAAPPHRVPLAAAPDLVPPPLAPIERFGAELTALGGVVHRVPDAGAAIERVLELCRERSVTRVLAWAEEQIGLPGLRAALKAAGIDWDTGDLPHEPSARHERLVDLAGITLGLTGTIGAIASSGTVAVVSGPGRSRLASLLPPVHVAVLRAAQLRDTLDELLAALPDAIDRGSNLVLITGPSRTGDIEMTLTRGVHGPGEVHVVLVE